MASVELIRETKKELPEQLLRYEIFMRLPVKSLVRCKFVCKSWLSLLSDPKFAKEHYNDCSMQNPNDYDYLVTYKNGTGLVIVSRNKETCVLPPDNYNLTKLIGSINGLIFLRHQHMLWLWNPAIHQCKEFASPCLRMRVRSRVCCEHFGFGFDPVSNDYKVVVYGDSLYRMDHAFVYSFNSDTWTALDVVDHVLPDISVTNTEANYRSTIVNVKDCPYWTSYYKHSSNLSETLTILKFETRSNEFKLFPDFQCRSGKNAILVDMMDRPTLMDYQRDYQTISVDVYSLDEGSGVWSKMYNVGPISSNSLNKNILQGFKYGGEIVFHKDGIFTYYDQKTDTISHTPGKYSYVIGSCYRYTPSLFCVEGMKLDRPLVQRHESSRSVGSID